VLPIIIAVVILALLYAILNGINDSIGIVAAMISSKNHQRERQQP
jgi:phosphate/sulfate permease